MICRADKYLAQQHGKELERIPGMVPVLPAFLDRAATPDDYHSAREPPNRSMTPMKWTLKSLGMMGRRMMTTSLWATIQRLNPAVTIWTKLIGQPLPTGPRGVTRGNVRKVGAGAPPMLGRKMKGVREFEEYIWKGYDDNRIKDAMLSSVKGQAYVNFCSCDEGRNCTLVQILREMDSIYNVSVTFWDLNARMCGLKQGMNEPIKTYYERMADISVKLEQYHGDRFGPGELKMMKKDCFYTGLKEHNKYLVSHMKDREQYGPAQMLKEIREQEDSHYPANTSPKPHHTDSGNKNTSHYNKNSSYDKPRVYTVRHTDVQIPDQEGDEPDSPPTNEIDPDEIYDEGYYVAVINRLMRLTSGATVSIVGKKAIDGPSARNH